MRPSGSRARLDACVGGLGEAGVVVELAWTVSAAPLEQAKERAAREAVGMMNEERAAAAWAAAAVEMAGPTGMMDGKVDVARTAVVAEDSTAAQQVATTEAASEAQVKAAEVRVVGFEANALEPTRASCIATRTASYRRVRMGMP